MREKNTIAHAQAALKASDEDLTPVRDTIARVEYPARVQITYAKGTTYRRNVTVEELSEIDKAISAVLGKRTPKIRDVKIEIDDSNLKNDAMYRYLKISPGESPSEPVVLRCEPEHSLTWRRSDYPVRTPPLTATGALLLMSDECVHVCAREIAYWKQSEPETAAASLRDLKEYIAEITPRWLGKYAREER